MIILKKKRNKHQRLLQSAGDFSQCFQSRNRKSLLKMQNSYPNGEKYIIKFVTNRNSVTTAYQKRRGQSQDSSESSYLFLQQILSLGGSHHIFQFLYLYRASALHDPSSSLSISNITSQSATSSLAIRISSSYSKYFSYLSYLTAYSAIPSSRSQDYQCEFSDYSTLISTIFSSFCFCFCFCFSKIIFITSFWYQLFFYFSVYSCYILLFQRCYFFSIFFQIQYYNKQNLQLNLKSQVKNQEQNRSNIFVVNKQSKSLITTWRKENEQIFLYYISSQKKNNPNSLLLLIIINLKNDFLLTFIAQIIIVFILFKRIYTMFVAKLILVALLLSTISTTEYTKLDLSNSWRMKILTGPANVEKLKSKTYQTSLPTTAHLDLLAAGDIPDPFIKDNYPTVKWVSDCSFLYSLNFKVTQQAFKHQFQKLVFQGIDTYADIILNNKKILSTANAFRQYSIYVQDELKQGVNTLEVLIKSSNPFDTAGQQSNPMPFAYAHTRKPGYQYSWDWAPYLNTLGIWKKVYLQSFNQVKIDYVWARTRSINKEKAVVNFAIALQLPSKQLSNNYEFKILQDGQKVATFKANEIHTYHDVSVSRPQLWWPNGIGKPHIYNFTVQLIKAGGSTLVDERKIPFGIRTISLDLSSKKFQVKVNGYSVYCKGANYVPPDMFYPRLQNDRFKPGNTIENLINDAVDSNFNMLRVWGGGQYESDKFLQLASRKGIMLFYDFMFSDSIYPSTEEFLLNVEEQVKQQIRRARNYPALALWSGNNQILQGIQDWGWGQGKYREDYKKLFEVLIPKIIEYQSPYISYIPSSPVYGVGNYGLQRGGDTHYWGVWAGGSNFESYQSNIGSFNSQFGTQGLPVWQTIIEAMSTNPSYQAGAVDIHQRHNSRFNTLRSYIGQYMKKSLNFELETYQSGLLQAYAIEVAIIAQRIAKPRSYGTLYWQFNDAWPAISWSSMDYFGRWKPLQYMAKRLYPDVAIFTLNNKVFAVSDKLYPVNALAIIEFFDLNGKLLHRVQKEVSLQINQVSAIYQIKDSDYKDSKKEECVVYTEIIAGKSQIMSSTFFNAKFKDLKLYPAAVQIEYNFDFNEITVQTKTTVVKNLYISHKETYLKTSNNYFDLLPGHPVKVVVKNPEGLDALKGGLVFRSYREVYTPQSTVEVNTK